MLREYGPSHHAHSARLVAVARIEEATGAPPKGGDYEPTYLWWPKIPPYTPLFYWFSPHKRSGTVKLGKLLSKECSRWANPRSR